MEHEEISELIQKNGGFMTLTELKEAYKDDNLEILEIKLNFLTEKNRVRKANFNSPNGPNVLYYTPKV